MFYGCDRYPECDFAVNNEPLKEPRCPVDGSLLVQRPKSIRCWGCGAEFDLDMDQTKDGRSRGRGRVPRCQVGRARSPRRREGRQEEARRQEEEDGCEEEARRQEEARRNEEARDEGDAERAAAEPASVASTSSSDEP